MEAITPAAEWARPGPLAALSAGNAPQFGVTLGKGQQVGLAFQGVSVYPHSSAIGLQLLQPLTTTTKGPL
jgi:hypothetical protein